MFCIRYNSWHYCSYINIRYSISWDNNCFNTRCYISYHNTTISTSHQCNNKPTHLNDKALATPNKGSFNCYCGSTRTTTNNWTNRNRLSWFKNNSWIITSINNPQYRIICTYSNQCILSYAKPTTFFSKPYPTSISCHHLQIQSPYRQFTTAPNETTTWQPSIHG